VGKGEGQQGKPQSKGEKETNGQIVFNHDGEASQKQLQTKTNLITNIYCYSNQKKKNLNKIHPE
jgi:hypothetical protein